MNHLPQGWGRPRDDIYGAYDHSYLQTSLPTSHTQSPVVTGTSVIAVKYKDGIVIAADNLASYGSLARFTDVKRLRKFNDRVILGFGGDVSDMQHIDRLLNGLSIREHYSHAHSQPSSDIDPADAEINAKNLHTYLSKVMYHRRTEINPLWNVILVAGLDDKHAPFMASVDLLGTTFSAPTLATGFGAHLALPILRRVVPNEEAAKNTSREQAEKLVQDCMKVLWYRDARSSEHYSVATVTKAAGVELREGERAEQQSWAFADKIRGYGTQTA